MNRKLKDIKLKNSINLLVVLIFIGINYYIYNFQFAPYFSPSLKPFIQFFFHILLFMTLWCIGKTVISDPGKVKQKSKKKIKLILTFSNRYLPFGVVF